MMQTHVLELTGGDEQLARELISLFIEDAPRGLAALRAGLDERDATAVYRAAHTLRGSAGNFGAPAVVASALEIEALARAGNVDGAARVFVGFERHLTAFIEELTRNL